MIRALLVLRLLTGCDHNQTPPAVDWDDPDSIATTLIDTNDGKCWRLIIGGQGYHATDLKLVGAVEEPCE